MTIMSRLRWQAMRCLVSAIASMSLLAPDVRAELPLPSNPFCVDCISAQADYAEAWRSLQSLLKSSKEKELNAEQAKVNEQLSEQRRNQKLYPDRFDRNKLAAAEAEEARIKKALSAIYDEQAKARRALESKRTLLDNCVNNQCFPSKELPSPASAESKDQRCTECAQSADRHADLAKRLADLRQLESEMRQIPPGSELDDMKALANFVRSIHARLVLARAELEDCRDEHKGRCVTVDPCLVGKWQANTGFTLKIDGDGTQTVDYSKLQPMVGGPQSFAFEGMATGRISTASSIVRIKSIERSTVKLRLKHQGAPDAVWDLKDRMGPGALGEATGEGTYRCQGDSLSYVGSTHRDRRPNYPVTLTRLKE